MSATRRTVINGIEIREAVIGSGEPVLMLHGWGASLDLLQPLAAPLQQQGYRLHLLDLPGFGESAEPPQPFSIFDYARFCRAYLDHHRLPAVHCFGHSLGGRIGLVLAADDRPRIQKMLLSNSAGIKTQPPLPARLRLRSYQSLRGGLERIGAQPLAARLRRLYSQRYASPDFQQASPIMQQTLIRIVNQDLQEHARRVSVPTVLVWGADDQETPLWMGRKLEAAIPDAALIVYENASHYAYLDFPDRTARIMAALFESG